MNRPSPRAPTSCCFSPTPPRRCSPRPRPGGLRRKASPTRRSAKHDRPRDGRRVLFAARTSMSRSSCRAPAKRCISGPVIGLVTGPRSRAQSCATTIRRLCLAPFHPKELEPACATVWAVGATVRPRWWSTTAGPEPREPTRRPRGRPLDLTTGVQLLKFLSPTRKSSPGTGSCRVWGYEYYGGARGRVTCGASGEARRGARRLPDRALLATFSRPARGTPRLNARGGTRQAGWPSRASRRQRAGYR